MNTTTVFNFLKKNADLKGNESQILEALKRLSSDNWWDGYETCLKHRRKRRLLEHIRRDTAVKRLLDYISDLTHGPQKK